jgi:outer membrane receptor protein involved in Fe transport
MKLFSSTILLLLFIVSLDAQTVKHYTISGYVKEEISGESLIGVNIYLPDHKTGTITNTYGFYSLTIPPADSVELIASYVGFTPEVVKVLLNKDIELNIELKQNILLNEVKITADRQEKQSESVKMSTISLQPSQIKNVPSLLGEKDVLKVLQLMPGVQKGSEGSSGLYVRGGGPDQNLIILDDAIVYNASHLFGFFSLFNGDALKSVELTKGGFPARFGGR